MECIRLKPINLRGSSLPILECGGIQLVSSQSLIVKAGIADRMLKQYKGNLEKDGTLERDRLHGGFYELVLGHAPIDRLKDTVSTNQVTEDLGENKSMTKKKSKRRTKGFV